MIAKRYKELFKGIKYSKSTDNFIGKNMTITLLNNSEEDENKAVELTLKEYLKMMK